MSKVRITTIAIAIILGVGAAWFVLPVLSRHRALNAITHADPSERRAGWTWLLVRDDAGRPRVAALLDRVNVALVDAGGEARVEAAAILRTIGLWGWDRQPHRLVLDEMAARLARGDELGVAEQLHDVPLDLEDEQLLPLVNTILQSNLDAARQAAFVAACGWAGPERGAWISRLEPRPDDVVIQRAKHLVAAWCRPIPKVAPLDVFPAPEVLDALLLRLVRFAPAHAGPVIALSEHPGASDTVTLPDVLRYSRDPAALATLAKLARDGNRGAEFALQTRSAARDEAQARLVLADPEQPVAARRLAAWRWDGIPAETVRGLLAGSPADAEGSVYAAALLAERRLPRDEAVTHAEAWIRSFDDDEKRAGALLSALLGVHAELLEEALDLEDMPRVRTVQRLALAALGVTIGHEDLDEFGFRVLHLPGGALNPDTLLCLLAAGRGESLQFLTRRPPGDAETLGRAVQKQAWLTERFVPAWHEVVGRPIGSSVRGLRLYFDDLEAARMLTHRRLEFDSTRRVFATP